MFCYFYVMRFDVIVGNPPYGRDKIGSRLLHFRILRTSWGVLGDMLCFVMPSKCLYDVRMRNERSLLKRMGCCRTEVVGGSAFGGTQMPDPAVYFCKKGSKGTDRRLEVHDNIFENDTERKIFGLMDTGATMWDHAVQSYGDWNKDYYMWNKGKDLKKMERYPWFVNVSYANYNEDGRWFAQKVLEGTGVLDFESEMEFIRNDRTTKTMLGLKDRKSADNVWRLLHTNLMRFCLWICQDDRNMKKKAWRLFPDIDYSKIGDERELLLSVGCEEEDIDDILKYVDGFDFKTKRKDRCLK